MGWFGKKQESGRPGDDRPIGEPTGAADSRGDTPYDMAETMPGELAIEMTVQDLAARLAANPAPRLLLLDVRETWEYEARRLEGTIHVPLSTVPGRAEEIAELAGDHELVVTICEHGMRSFDAACFLQDHGILHTRSMNGGMAHWAMAIGERMTSGPAGGDDQAE
jgi:rhodanese-related sulfurtransferase